MLNHSIFAHRQFRYLGAFYLHSITRLFAVALFQLFNGIYIFQSLRGLNIEYHHALSFTTLIFALIFLVQALSVAPSLWLIAKKGLKFSVMWGSMFLILFYLMLILGATEPIFFILAAVCGGAQIGLYWTSYHLYFAELTDDKRQVKELSLSSALSSIVSIGAPAFGGLVISYSGFNMLFIVISILLLLAIWPLKYLPPQKDIISVDILKTVFALAPKMERKSYLALFGISITDITYMLFWPIFIFPIMTAFVGVGFTGSLVSFIAMLTTIAAGFLIDRYGPKRVIRILAPLDAIVWVIKSLTNTPFQVFFASGASAVTRSTQAVTLDSSIYQRARHEDLVAFIVQREVGMSVGKFLFLLILSVLFWLKIPLMFAFFFAAPAALFTRLYPYETKKDLSQNPDQDLFEEAKETYNKIMTNDK